MTEDLRTTTCPDAEQLAEYVEGRLTAEARARVEAHLADCEVCRQVVANAFRDLPATVVPFWKRPKVIGGALALAASLVVAVGLQWNPFRGPTPYEELVAAVGTNRTVEGRLSGGFAYGPRRSPTRSSNTVSNVEYGVLAAVARIRDAAGEHASAEQARALGVAELVAGNFDQSVTALESSVAQNDGAPDAWSDLAAAYLARGRTLGKPADFQQALAAVDRALYLNDSLTEALFNRPLILTELGRSEDARAAWTRYLEVDPSSSWGDEARTRLSDLGPPSSGRKNEPVTFFPASSMAGEFSGKFEPFVRGRSARVTQAMDFPASFWANAHCSATLVGPHVLVSAKHCFEGTTTVSIKFGEGQRQGTCEVAPALPSGESGPDVALCDIDAAEGIQYETISAKNILRVRQRVLLTGWGGKPEAAVETGRHLAGTTTIRNIAAGIITTRGDAFLTEGDSGGAGFVVAATKRIMVSVNASVKGQTSFLWGLFAAERFIDDWRGKNSRRRICGINLAGPTCR